MRVLAQRESERSRTQTKEIDKLDFLSLNDPNPVLKIKTFTKIMYTVTSGPQRSKQTKEGDLKQSLLLLYPKEAIN